MDDEKYLIPCGHMERFEETEAPPLIEGEIRYEHGWRWMPDQWVESGQGERQATFL